MTRHEWPTWCTPGQVVAVLTGDAWRGTERLTWASVDRVLTRDVVLTNGERFRITGVVNDRDGTMIRRPADSWSPSDYLLPEGHPRIAAVELRIRGRRDAVALRSLAEQLDRLAREWHQQPAEPSHAERAAELCRAYLARPSGA